MDKPLPIAAKKTNAGTDAENGRRIYGTFCVVCHQPDGKGGALPGSPAVSQATLVAANFTLRGKNAPLSKADADLVKIITEGAPGKPMPPFGSVLKPEEIRDVLAYLRAAFGAEHSSKPSNP